MPDSAIESCVTGYIKYMSSYFVEDSFIQMGLFFLNWASYLYYIKFDSYKLYTATNLYK